eukprot:GHRR01030005.1.p1 GENE.GHRR01030005.1~~GHRR01030005.1.p1  ORF type:complete len:125 (-),score=25.52 GHRR01030005.1:13-387(-)
MDCTGSGDVDTSMAVTAVEQGYIIGASGRRLKIDPNWHNPSKEWHVGYRHAFELFPKPLQVRCRVASDFKLSWGFAAAASTAVCGKYATNIELQPCARSLCSRKEYSTKKHLCAVKVLMNQFQC